MKIGLDYWPATTHPSGVGRSMRELVRALVRLENGPELRLLDVGPGPRSLEGALGIDGARVRRLKVKLPRRTLQWSAKLGLGADRWLGGCELFHGVFPGFPPLSNARSTIAVAEFPSAGTSLAGYDAVITFSTWAASELTRRFELDPRRVHVVPVGCEHFARDLAKPTPRDTPPLVLVLGRLDVRRAPPLVLAACERLRQRGLATRLAFLGRRGDAYDELRARVTRSPMCAAVHFVSAPREDELVDHAARASVLVHLNDEELSPVTPLEAFACGANVVASRLPAFEEAFGEHATFVDGPTAELRAEDLADAIAEALARAPTPRGWLDAFTWERHASLTSELWRRILGAV